MTRDQYTKASLIMSEIRTLEKVIQETEDKDLSVRAGSHTIPSSYVSDKVRHEILRVMAIEMARYQKLLGAI